MFWRNIFPLNYNNNLKVVLCICLLCLPRYLKNQNNTIKSSSFSPVKDTSVFLVRFFLSRISFKCEKLDRPKVSQLLHSKWLPLIQQIRQRPEFCLKRRVVRKNPLHFSWCHKWEPCWPFCSKSTKYSLWQDWVWSNTAMIDWRTFPTF